MSVMKNFVASFVFVKLSLFVLLAVDFQPCLGVPFQSYQGALTWDWDRDHESSGNGDPEEPITTLTDSTGSQSWIQISSERWGDHERPLPKTQRGMRKICALDPNCERNPKGRQCNSDRNCEKSQFCHENYKYCDRRRYVGQKCRRTENCIRGAICMWGQCYKEKKPGLARSRCKRHIDCASSLCCAREHGESICKPWLKEGQNCSVSSGGYVYSMQHDCSCGLGLVCKTVEW
eukprot:gene3026-3485_t